MKKRENLVHVGKCGFRIEGIDNKSREAAQSETEESH